VKRKSEIQSEATYYNALVTLIGMNGFVGLCTNRHFSDCVLA